MPSPTSTDHRIDRRIVDATASTLLATLPSGVNGNVQFDAKGGSAHMRIQTTNSLTLISAGTNAAKAGGIKIFDWPRGMLIPLGASIKGTLRLSTAAMSTTAGEIGLGSVVASGAVAVLGGTATFEDILEGGQPALGNIAAAGTVTIGGTSGVVADDVRAFIDGRVTPVDMYLNAATTFANQPATDLTIDAGARIDVWFRIIPAV